MLCGNTCIPRPAVFLAVRAVCREIEEIGAVAAAAVLKKLIESIIGAAETAARLHFGGLLYKY